MRKKPTKPTPQQRENVTTDKAHHGFNVVPTQLGGTRQAQYRRHGDGMTLLSLYHRLYARWRTLHKEGRCDMRRRVLIYRSPSKPKNAFICPGTKLYCPGSLTSLPPSPFLN
jgi:hypothetical protein